MSRIIFYKWTNRLNTLIFHYIQPYLRLKSKQSIDMAGPCSILMDFSGKRQNFGSVQVHFIGPSGKSRGRGLVGFPVTVPASPRRPLARSIYAKAVFVDSLLGALGFHLVAKLFQDGAKMFQDSPTQRQDVAT